MGVINMYLSYIGNIIRVAAIVVGGILAIMILRTDSYSRSEAIMPYMLTCVVISQIFASVDYYKEGKKIKSIITSLLCILTIAVIFKIVIL
ncbi:hypothetical protein GOQ27_05315 [Clostridium sp. D2Q-11]|uniref:Uncharacterized protein n=1 Tax=Anaeromonas frigoriresistens TaxID=2683708 RepID=A0A942UTU1_9FIRM|nr:hypothetical protein [Anaeromonas frigoriresistens]MBS4537870.1 hypothetical protein [Anaeromonas frigoriresistens]